jgi:hypothetical protein
VCYRLLLVLFVVVVLQVLLSKIEYFRNLIKHEMKESTSGCVRLSLYSSTTIELLLDYCYFHRLPTRQKKAAKKTTKKTTKKKGGKGKEEAEEGEEFVFYLLELHSLSHYLMYQELHVS